MFQALFKRAENVIEQSIGQLVARIVMVVPFVVAAGFGTAALSLRLSREYGSEVSYLIMAGLFVGLGVVVAAIIAARQPATVGGNASAQADDAGNGAEQSTAETAKSMSETDRELLLAALTSVAPIAVPHLARLLLRNLPLMATIAAGIYVMTRPSPPASQPMAAE